MNYDLRIDGVSVGIIFPSAFGAIRTINDVRGLPAYAESIFEIWSVDDAGTEALVFQRRAKVLLGRRS